MGRLVKQHTINPKALSRTQLLGQIDLDTRQWTDGVLTLSALQVYSEPPGKCFSFLSPTVWHVIMVNMYTPLQ